MKEYDELIKAFAKLNKGKKQQILRDEIQELLMFFHKLCLNKDETDKILTHESMKKLEDNEISDDDFLNGMYAYIISFKESVGKYLNK